MNSLNIRRATLEDIPHLQRIFTIARKFMVDTGNAQQWTANYPSEDLLRSDIERGNSYVVERGKDCVGEGCVVESEKDCVVEGKKDCVVESEKDCVGESKKDCVVGSEKDCVGESKKDCVVGSEKDIVATFVLCGEKDPTYDIIYEGAWKNDLPYGTIHRIATNGQVKGIMHLAMEFALKQYDTIRIDTHRDNVVMQNAIRKENFEYCGIIHCWNGSERLAFQYTKKMK